jgi:hypothetical protein
MGLNQVLAAKEHEILLGSTPGGLANLLKSKGLQKRSAWRCRQCAHARSLCRSLVDAVSYQPGSNAFPLMLRMDHHKVDP